MIVFNNPTDLPWQHHVLDLVMLCTVVAAVVFSVRRKRDGDPTFLVLLLCALAYGLLLEFTTGMLISRSYIQGDFTFMLHTSGIPGYETDMPAYILLLYPTFIFVGFCVVSGLGIESIALRAVSAGVVMVMIDAPYVVLGPISHVGWWTWLDWQINGQAMFQYWYTWPLTDAYWEMTWPGLLMYCVWRWQAKREQSPGGLAAPLTWRDYLRMPVITALIVNLLGFVVTAPISIVMALRWPHYLVIVPTLFAEVVVLIYCAKKVAAMLPITPLLVGIHLVGYGSVALALLAEGSEYTGELMIVTVASAVLVVLATYPVVRRRLDERARLA